MKLYASKYPISTGYSIQDDKAHEPLPVGTIFRMDGINGFGFDLAPLKKNEHLTMINVSPEMLAAGFTETEYTD